jgi:hypothetical protein
MADEVNVKFTADISDLQKGMLQASAAIDATNKSMRNGATQIAASFGALSEAYASSAVQKAKSAKEGSDNELAIAREQETTQFDIAMNGVKMQEAVIKSSAQTAQTSHQQELTSLLALENEREAIELRHLQVLQSTYAANSTEYASTQRKIDELASQSALRRVQVELSATKEIYSDFRRTFDQIASSVSSNIMSMIEGHEKLRQAAKKVLLSIIQDFISARIRTVADWLAGQAANVVATTAAQTQQTAAVVTSQAAQTTAVATGTGARAAAAATGQTAVLAADAKGVFGGIFSFLAPIMGPAAAGPAAGGAGVVMSGGSYAIGSWELPSDVIAQVHQGEMIVPAAQTPWAQGVLSNAAGGGGGGDVHNHFSPTVHVNGGGNAKDVSDLVVKTLKEQHKRGAFLGYQPRFT